jgi:hypothetical protein
LYSDEFVEILHGRILDAEAARDFRPLDQRDLVEQQSRVGEYIKAKQSHRFLLQARSYDRVSSAKYL